MTTLADKIVPYATAFRRDGFVMVPDLLGADELERYGAAVDEAVARRKRFDNRKLGDKTPYEQSFIQCIILWEDTPAVRPLTFHPIVCETAARLLGVEKLRLWHDQALYKEAGGRLTDPHQDQPYWPMVETDTITAWIPFDGSTHATGCMGYIPGSHAVGLRAFVNIFKPEDALETIQRSDRLYREAMGSGIKVGLRIPWFYFVARTMREQLTRTGHIVHGLPTLGTVRVPELIHGPPLFCAHDTPIREAAEAMTAHGVSAILVSGAERPGIVTDADLRARVVAGEVSRDDPVEAIAGEAVRVDPDRLAVDAVVDDIIRQLGLAPAERVAQFRSRS